MSALKPYGVVEKLPDSFWLQHKDTLHRLYVVENKSLRDVKQIMEDENGFQPQRLCDYEVALRELLHFRKNLKREEWRAIEFRVSERKRQHKESEVIWNNTPFEAKKLRKELLRNSKPKLAFTRKVNLELPQGLVIRTPPRSPTTTAAVLLPLLEPQLAITPATLPQVVSGGNKSAINSFSAADETIWQVQQTLFEAGESGISPYRKLRENLPFNRCMSQIVDLAQSHQLHLSIPTAETWTPVFPRLFGANPSWELLGGQTYQISNNGNYLFIPENAWFVKWVGISADFALLKLFFSINSPTAGAVYERLLEQARRLRMTSLVAILFALRLVLKPNNPTSVNDTGFVDAAVRIARGSRSDDCLDILKICLSNKSPNPATKDDVLGDLASDWVLTAAERERGDIVVLRALVDAGWKVEACSHDRSAKSVGRLMNRIYDWALQKEDGLTGYIELLLRGGALTVTALAQCNDDQRPRVIAEARAICSITWDELVMISPSMMRQTLQMAYTRLGVDQGATINRAGVFTVAQDCASALRAYLEAHREEDPFLTRVILQECLLFSAILNDSNTALSLLEIGVDPHVGLLSNNLERYEKGNLPWNPAIVAAATGNLEVLSLLLSRNDISSFLDNAPIHELVQHRTHRETTKGDVMGRELCRMSNLQRSYLHAHTRSSKLAAENSLDDIGLCDPIALIPTGKIFETLEYIRSIAHSHGYGQKVDLEIIKAAVCRPPRSQLLLPRFHGHWHLPCEALLMKGLIDAYHGYRAKGMDLLHLSIRNHCSFPVVRFLSDQGFKVHSNPGGKSRNSMLHDALLSRSPDRSEIIEFLLGECADPKICGDGLTILEASLLNFDLFNDEKSEYCRIFERLLDAGATAYHWHRPLIKMLLVVQASDDLILRVVDAGAPLHAYGYGYRQFYQNLTPLQAAVSHGRERLACELIRRGADVHAPASPQKGLTALQAACLHNLPARFLEYLVVGLGVEVNEHPAHTRGYTSLAAAVKNGSLNTVEFLLDHGADINATCSNGAYFCNDRNQLYRPLDVATCYGRLDLVEFLLQAGGRSRKDGLGGAIDMAASMGNYAVLSVLRSWNEKHGRRILEEETLWQVQNPVQAVILTESTDDLCYSESDDSKDEDHNEDEDDTGGD